MRARRSIKSVSEVPFADRVARFKFEAKDDPKDDTKVNVKVKSKASEDVVGFLRSRPQINAMQKRDSRNAPASKRKTFPISDGNEAADLLQEDRFENHPGAWQQNETVVDFLRRLPVAEPGTARVGPWLWVGNPNPRSDQRDHCQEADVDAFIEGGQTLLDAFSDDRTKLEDENKAKSAGAITRKLAPHKEQLEDSILSLAVRTGTTCGKWMLFPSSEDLPRTWRLVAEATAAGRLGPTSKVATYDPAKPDSERVICVYTYNFMNHDDVRRVLDELVEMNLCSKDSSRGIWYKCDAYTYLDLRSDNAYKIRVTLYGSKKTLSARGTETLDGPIARLKKRIKKIDSFLSPFP